jgi:hypothetical protein
MAFLHPKASFPLERLHLAAHLLSRNDKETGLMRNLLWNRVTAPNGRRLRHDPYGIDPPAPLQIFTRLGLLFMVALAFGLVAELLARLPQ